MRVMDEEFDRESKARWVDAIDLAFRNAPPHSAQWIDPVAMLRVLTPFMGVNLNHTLLPGGGGLDMEAITISSEPECLEFRVDEHAADLFRPATLLFEHFSDSPWNSFFLLRTQPLEPCGLYEEDGGCREVVVEIAPGKYVQRSHGESRFLGYDANGREIPLPSTARTVTRYMRGSFLIGAKRSLWNLDTSTCDGRHNGASAQQIRATIQEALTYLSKV
jgi:hypothetical protein